MPEDADKPTPPARSAETLAAAAAELLHEVVRTTAAGDRPATARGRELFERLRSTLFSSPADDAATPEAARTVVAVALDRVPVGLRGAPSAWEAMLDAVAGKLFESDGARAHLDALLRSLRAVPPEAS